MNITVETKREVWDDDGGYCYRVGPDVDALGLVEIAYVEGGKVHTSMTMQPALARKMAECLLKCADEVEATE